MRNIALLICGLLVLGLSCRKDIDFVEESFVYPGVKEYVKATISGIIIDENEQPISNVTILIGNKATKTDFNGVFQLKNLIVESNNTTVRAIKTGYFTGFRTINVTLNSKNKIQIQLLALNNVNAFQSSNGGIVSNNNYSVEIPANAVMFENGISYNGDVKVYTKWLDPTDKNLGDKMPGRLLGLSTNGSFTGLISMGMLAVELYSSSGYYLKLKEGVEATIRMKVPTTLLSSAPAQIPLWYYHPLKGIWVEEGYAILNNGFYEGKVNHFSFWNCDYPTPLVEIKFIVKDIKGQAIPGAKVYTKIINNSPFGTGYTDNEGVILGLVPKNEILLLKVYAASGQCIGPVVEKQIGPFYQNDSITVIVDYPTFNTALLTGFLLDCNYKPVKNGYIKNISDNNIIWPDENGHFETLLSYCNNPGTSIVLVGYDNDALKVSEEYNVTLKNNIFDADTIQTCKLPSEYISYTFEGNTYTYLDPNIYKNGDLIHIYKAATINEININLSFKQPSSLGLYDIETFVAYGKDKSGNVVKHGCKNNSGKCSDIKVNVTKYDLFSQSYIAGTYSGMVVDSSDNSNIIVIPISGTFGGKVK